MGMWGINVSMRGIWVEMRKMRRFSAAKQGNLGIAVTQNDVEMTK